ncbi:Predicted DNA-binding transcriptional regulator YafY, contains an HTH and WYL domains [Paenibacillus algorifonticola]|uniref:Predicted DNA-binding transcriptional regulator YafY, contains an HTH and WYL domains n=1 Tax=Paenibacillus algorifonticola TaxID=684063 RepID=A0A1I2I271_9BACL|nr:YafY family protein [Paenibacillus algorifonticola]SFF35768.1 Predicted DNA-binding transcriptional regulator YafY, contains an HTH and WYL domains [Paenibacillus algorifonticola]
MDKVERLISIIMILLKKEVVSTKEFTQLFNVSKRTILRDMETLSLSNIPIYSVNGVKGGYGIMDEYKVDKRLLSSSDLQNILTALGGLEQILRTEEVERTIKKIEAMVSPLSLNRSIQLSFYDWEGRSEILETLKTCQEAILKKRLVSFDYTDKDGAVTNRMVEPYELHFSESSWYLKGFCLHRQGYRTFKLSRIDHITMDERACHPRDDWSEQGHEASYLPQLVTIKAWISPSIKDQIIERYGRRNIEDHSSGFLLATIYVPQNRMGFQFLASFGTHLKVVEPKTYVEDFRNYLYQMMENYS